MFDPQTIAYHAAKTEEAKKNMRYLADLFCIVANICLTAAIFQLQIPLMVALTLFFAILATHTYLRNRTPKEVSK